MGRFAAWIRASAFTLGVPGLFLVAFVDSSFLSLPEVADILVVLMVARQKALMPLLVVSATLGSLAGCLIIFYLGRKGGEAFVRKRFRGPSVDRTLSALRRYGLLAVLVPSILPPPMPFKIFVFMAGIAEISVLRFSLAIILGRGGRYLALGILAVTYGDQAMSYVRDHAVAAALAAVGVLAVGVAGYLLWSKRRSANSRQNPV
jgi:membrane protein YqaA with SNARE-associated domain